MRRMTFRIAFALALLLVATRLASAQAPLVPASSGGQDLDRDIAEYEDTLKKIRDQKWIYLPAPGAGVLITPEQEANMFSYLILTGQMSPDSVASKHRQYRAATRFLQTTIEDILQDLYAQRAQRGGPAPPSAAPVTPNKAHGSVGGNWVVPCVTNDTPTNEAGTFSLTLVGDGSVRGTYSGPSGSFVVGGSIDEAGIIQGGGTHPDGAFSYTARIEMIGGTSPRFTTGSVTFVPTSSSTTCRTGRLTSY